VAVTAVGELGRASLRYRGGRGRGGDWRTGGGGGTPTATGERRAGLEGRARGGRDEEENRRAEDEGRRRGERVARSLGRTTRGLIYISIVVTPEF
jgi:hypothetical protein